MAGMKPESFFRSAFPAGFPAQLPPHSCVKRPSWDKTEKDSSCLSLGLFLSLLNTSLQG